METTDIRLVALDCDGTLFSRHGTLSEYSAGVLKQLRENGITVVICTGRPVYSIQRAIEPQYYDYAVCGNGFAVIRNDGAVLYRADCMKKEELRELLRYVEEKNVMLSVSYEDSFHHFCSKKHHIAVWSVQKLKNIARRILGRSLWKDTLNSDYEIVVDKQIEKVCYSGMPAVLKEIRDSIDGSRYSRFLVTPMWLEIMPYGIDKGSGMRRVMEMLGIEKEKTAAVGDGENDLPMLRTAGCAVAMRNAMESLKSEADYITEEDYDNDGAAVWMSRHILKNTQ
jgi:Cof subfamily protein (haloacid dehalogenase superfamily)